MSEVPPPITPEQARPDSRVLRARGDIDQERPLVPLEHKPLEIISPSMETAPQGPVDAVVIFGHGAVQPVLVGPRESKEVTIGKSKMRHNALATLELAARGYIKKDGLVIPSGTSTADPEDVDPAIAQKDTPIMKFKQFVASLGEKALNVSRRRLNFRWNAYKAATERTIRRAPTVEQAEDIYTMSEAEEMKRLFERARSKVKNADGTENISGVDTKIEVFADHLATETGDNFIFALNELDRRARKENRGLFTGTIAAVTSDYHEPRVWETARYLGIEKQVVPLASQEVLKESGYRKDKLYSEGAEAQDASTAVRGNENKWVRTTRQMPQYFLPMLAKIEDNERLVNTLSHLKELYKDEGGIEKFGLIDLRIENAADLRLKLLAIVRQNPEKAPWMEEDISEVNKAVEVHKQFTQDWLKANAQAPTS